MKIHFEVRNAHRNITNFRRAALMLQRGFGAFHFDQKE